MISVQLQNYYQMLNLDSQISIQQRANNRTSLGDGRPSKQSSKVLEKRFRLNEKFIHKMSRPKTLTSPHSYSRHRDSSTVVEQLNKLLLLRKASKQKHLFDDTYSENDGKARSKQQINEDIDNSIQYIENIKLNRHMFQQANSSNFLPKIKKTQSISEALGLQLQFSQQKNSSNRVKPSSKRFLTQPVDCNTRRSQGKPGSIAQIKGQKAQIGLYSYLQRDFVSKKRQLSSTKVFKYARYPNNKNYQKQILQKSRKFLKDKAKNNYRQINKVFEYIEDESKKMINDETSKKRDIYKRQYSVRRNVPYFSFLTMNPKQKQAVLRSLNKRNYQI